MRISLDEARKLHQKKYREASGCFLVEGEHLVLELEKAAALRPELAQSTLFVSERYRDWPSSFHKQVLSDRQMAQLSDTKTPQGIIAVAPQLTANAAVGRAVYLYEIQDPGNLGTLLRSLAWFGGFRCLLSPNSVDPYNTKAVRASMGAIFHVPLEVDVDFTSLKSRFTGFACLDMRGEDIAAAAFQSQECLIFGNEARGIPQDAVTLLNPQRFTIPGNTTIESLNLATAVSLCAYELSRTPPA